MENAELQTDDEILEPAETGAELAPAEAEDVKVPDGYIKAEDAQKDINKQHRKYRDEERARKKVETELEQARRELEEFKAKSVDLSIPPPPDPYAEDYAEQTKVRDEAIARKAAHDAEQSRLEASQQSAQEEAETARDEAKIEQVKSFDDNLVKLGMNPLEVKKAADTVVDYGVSEDLESFLLTDEEGPLFVQYLAQNPVEQSELNAMSAFQQFKYLEGIRPKAQLLKPKTSAAPDPGTELSGGGVPELEDPLLKGATFE